LNLWTRVGVSVLAVVIAFGGMVVLSRPTPAHADSLLKELIDEAVLAVVKNLVHHPEWSDEDLKENMDEEVNHVVNGVMDPNSEMTQQAISDHCWRVYVAAWHPDVWAGRGYAEAPLPGDYLPTDDYGYSSVWDQLNVCVRTGHVPADPYDTDRGSMDIE
jgi:hypothetical protein